ncbi:hypothetical protein [Polaromonas sp.]|uniref:hypothetical protein n=1 Tax=Polaromonas sp. TaxID=1869339 RepID=UPI003751272B
MASTNSKGALPTGFTSPFTLILQQDRFDDLLVCAAILTGRPMADVRKLAEQFGLPKTGPYWVDNVMTAKLLMNLGSLVATSYKEFTSFAALPDVAILLVDYSETTEIGRHVIWHHIRGTKEQQAFSYVIDPALHISAPQQMSTEFGHLKPAWYVEVTAAKAGGKAK